MAGSGRLRLLGVAGSGRLRLLGVAGSGRWEVEIIGGWQEVGG